MFKKIEQNQLLNIDEFLSEGKIELVIKIVDDNIKKISQVYKKNIKLLSIRLG